MWRGGGAGQEGNSAITGTQLIVYLDRESQSDPEGIRRMEKEVQTTVNISYFKYCQDWPITQSMVTLSPSVFHPV